MKNEIRNISSKLIPQFVATHNELLGVGSERCVHKFCSELKDLLALDRTNKKIGELNFRIVSPRVPEAYVDSVIKYMKEVNDKFNVESIVINDYGILNRLKHIKNFNLQLILGRTLIKSLEYVPWSDYILRNEDENVKRNLLLPNIYHLSKLELFSKFNVEGVELCATPSTEASIIWLKEKGMKVFVHFNTVIAAIGRTCPTARIYKAKIDKCINMCDKDLTLKLKENWGSNCVVKTDIVPTYHCIGNTVYYYKENNKLFPYELSDGVIYDYILNMNEVKKMIS